MPAAARRATCLSTSPTTPAARQTKRDITGCGWKPTPITGSASAGWTTCCGEHRCEIHPPGVPDWRRSGWPGIKHHTSWHARGRLRAPGRHARRIPLKYEPEFTRRSYVHYAKLWAKLLSHLAMLD